MQRRGCHVRPTHHTGKAAFVAYLKRLNKLHGCTFKL